MDAPGSSVLPLAPVAMATPTVRSVDLATLPKHFDAPAAEAKWQRVWDDQGVHRYDPSRPREETFVVDTPPPTVSGSLHMGHVFSYTHTDVVVRQRRMAGWNIYYPMGWDDNGLPTERRVQNLYHVRTDVKAPLDPDLSFEQATPAQVKASPPRTISRPDFIKLCQRVTRDDEQVFKELWRRMGTSVDWTQEYATIGDRCRTLAQYSFLDLHAKGHVYCVDAPTMWDVDFQTAVAQAEVEDRPRPGAFHDIAFGVEGSDREFVIATTRPELLPACVGVCAHPDDARYKDLFGKRAVTPLFGVAVPIFPSVKADPTKGTGILMVCTFGDQTDVEWWREQKLSLRQVLGRDGRFVPVHFGDVGWECSSPDVANARYASLVGRSVKQAQRAIVEMLGASAEGGSAPLRGTPKPVERSVRFYEKGDQPLEYISTRQWFVRLLDKKDDLLAKGAEVKWHPEHMHSRFEHWTKNLNVDWCISRQRHFGVQFPVWYPLNEEGAPQYDRPILAGEASLPVDPTVDVPAGYSPEQRDVPNGFTAESDVFDTWFTSSLTPQIGSHWVKDPERHKRLFPADIRPQSHEIIRTWAFYTIAKALLHEGTIPWKNVLVSGWILDPDRKKMSKSVGNVVTPMHLLDNYSSDGVRYWAATARLGTDTAFDEKVFKVGKRLVTKLFNAGKYVLGQTGEVHPITHPLDRAFVGELRELTERATAAFADFDYARALEATEQFFWARFCDSYLELAKGRARGEEGTTVEERGSAVAALRLGLDVLLRLFAPVVPFITEEVWSWCYAEERGQPSIHRAPWPSERDFAGIAGADDPRHHAMATAAMAAINKRKSESGASVGRVVVSLTLAAKGATLGAVVAVLGDVMLATRVKSNTVEARESVGEGEFEVLAMELAPAADKESAAVE